VKIQEIVTTLLEDDTEGGEFDPNELARGQKVEMEHTNDPQIAERIAKDHLREHPYYYTILAKTPIGHDA